MAKLSLQCDSCNWKFRRSVKVKLCPNCGKQSVSEDKRQGAADILRELDDLTSQFDKR